ncbi:MAG: PDZ domain-containing protein, partial [Acidobacteriota bacterium]|nr:PDZ domain-containing protein [Acidobacteriota bacterium]
VHTNVIAGLALDDGRTIAAWLPEAEAEMPPPPIPFAPVAPAPLEASPPNNTPGKTMPAPAGPPEAIPRFPVVPFDGNLLEPADLKIITRDGKKLLGRYIGLDGLTGLSVIVVNGDGLPKTVDSKEETISVGQRLRLIGPEPASHFESNARSPMYVRIGETEAWVVNVRRSPSGGIARLKISSAKLSPANIGAIAINDSGETLGIVDAVEDAEATIVPVALVRSAAKRVIEKQASVPRPWLGIRGEPIGTVSLDRILRGGWQLERARSLAEKRQGILLTSIAPHSPAAFANLKPGDVILRVNNGDVRNADDLSWLLDEAGSGSEVHFTVARPGGLDSEAFEIKLSESPEPFFRWRFIQGQPPKASWPGSLIALGIESIALKPRVAFRFGATGGLLVVSVQPTTAAFKAGLRPGDVIESINGQQLLPGSLPMELLNNPGGKSTFSIVRNKQKLVLTAKVNTKQ